MYKRQSGHYFSGGNAHSKLKKYFVFLQRYLLTKEELPADLQTVFHSLHGQLLADVELYATYEEAEAAAREFLAAGERDQDSSGPQDAAENDTSRDDQQPEQPEAAAAEDPDAAEQADDDLFEKELASIIPDQVRTADLGVVWKSVP